MSAKDRMLHTFIEGLAAHLSGNTELALALRDHAETLGDFASTEDTLAAALRVGLEECDRLRTGCDALCAAILDLERADATAHAEDCPGRDHVAGDSCGADGEGGWTCCEGLSEEECVAAERERCSCGLIAWRDRMRSAADLARGLRGAEDWRARAMAAETERDALRAIVEGRPTAPTQEEIAAHPGQWLVYYAARFEDRQPARTRLLDRTRATAAAAARWPTAPSRWCPVRDGRPCAWPVVEVSRG